MPHYKKDYQKEVNEDEVQTMMVGQSLSNKVAIALLYITGARPIEIVMLKKEDIIVFDDVVRIGLKTVKRGLARTLEFDRKTTPFIEELIIPFLSQLSENSPLFHYKTSERLKQIVYKASNNILTPYTFRHNRMYKLAKLGADPYELMAWKGAKDMDSVAPYVIRAGFSIKKFRDKIK